MRIVFLGRYNTTENISGPEYVARNVFYQIKKRNRDTSFVQYFFDGTKYSLFQKLFGSEIIKDSSDSIYRKGIIPLFIFLLREKPEVIHIITFERFAFVAFIYRLFCKVKIFYNVHGIVYYENNVLRNGLKVFFILKDKIFEHILFRYSDLQLFLSKRSIKLAENYFNIRHEKVAIVPNGLEEVYIEPKINSIEESEKPLQIVFVASLKRPEKGIEFILKALQSIPFSFVAYIIGDHKVNDEIVNQGTLHYMPIMEHRALMEFFSDKHIFISASHYEPFSISVLEAMYQGLVPIMTSETGLSEYIEDGIHGYVCNYGDTKSLVDILTLLHSDRSMLERASTAAKEFALQMTWEKIVERYYLPLYKKLSSEKLL